MGGADEGPVVQIAHRLLQFGAGVHHDRPVPSHRLFNRRARDQEEAHTFRPGLNRHLIAGAKADERAVARHIADVDLFAADLFLKQHARGGRGIGESARALEDIGEGPAVGVDLKGLLDPCGHENIQILRVSRDAIDGAAFAPELAGDDFHPRAVVVGHHWDIAGLHILITRRGHLLG